MNHRHHDRELPKLESSVNEKPARKHRLLAQVLRWDGAQKYLAGSIDANRPCFVIPRHSSNKIPIILAVLNKQETSQRSAGKISLGNGFTRPSKMLSSNSNRACSCQFRSPKWRTSARRPRQIEYKRAHSSTPLYLLPSVTGCIHRFDLSSTADLAPLEINEPIVKRPIKESKLLSGARGVTAISSALAYRHLYTCIGAYLPQRTSRHDGAARLLFTHARGGARTRISVTRARSKRSRCFGPFSL